MGKQEKLIFENIIRDYANFRFLKLCFSLIIKCNI